MRFTFSYLKLFVTYFRPFTKLKTGEKKNSLLATDYSPICSLDTKVVFVRKNKRKKTNNYSTCNIFRVMEPPAVFRR